MSQKLSITDIEAILARRFAEDRCHSLASMPHPALLKNITKAAKRIKRAIEQKEKIAVVGDYDADGVISSVIMTEFFEDIGVEVALKIPNRFTDGYGISPKIIAQLDVDLIITVDNGISAVEAAQACLEKGIDLIITDHHALPQTLPCAFAIINPKQPDCDFPNSEICGAQVAWYLAAAIKDELGITYDLSKFLDILAIAIVADMMELRDINRAMVKYGMKSINKLKRPFFKAVGTFFKKNGFKSDDISFLLAPLINSSGRLEDAMLSYRLIRSKNEFEAMQNLEYIVSINNQRKEIEQELFAASLLEVDEKQNIIIAAGEGWHEGVIGIVASRLTHRFKKPAIVFSLHGNIAKGSARSVGEIDILSYISEQKAFLLGFGGHKGAAGMSLEVENFKLFKGALEASMSTIDPAQFEEKSEVLGEIDPMIIDFDLLDLLEAYEPYGQHNPKPSFMVKNTVVKAAKLIGQNLNHQKLTLQSGSKLLESIEFNFQKQIESGGLVDVICTLSRNEFKGTVSPQVMIKHVKQLS